MASSYVNEATPLSDEQRGALESMLEGGHVAGITSVYWELIGSMVYGEWCAQQRPGFSVDARAPRNTEEQNGEESGGKGELGRTNNPQTGGYVLHRRGHALHTGSVPHGTRIRRCIRLPFYTSAHLPNTCLCCHAICKSKDRPISTTAQKGFEEFTSRIRRAAKDDDLHPLKIRTDNGSEFVGGACKAWLNSSRVDHPGFYEHTTTTGSRSAGNPFAERAIQSWRRLLYAQY